MPTNIFFNLPEDKRRTIVDAAIEEFGEHGFLNASTNNIVSKAGISKGSLFQYFPTKDDLYLYLMEMVSYEIYGKMQDHLNNLPEDFLDKVELLFHVKIETFTKNLKLYEFMITLSDVDNPELFQKIMIKMNPFVQNFYGQFVAGANAGNMRVEQMTAFRTLNRISEGIIREDLHKRSSYESTSELIETIKKKIDRLIRLLRYGMLK